MIYHFSEKTNSLYPEELLPEYSSANTLPDDLIALSEWEYEVISSAKEVGNEVVIRDGKIEVLEPKQLERTDDRMWRNAELARVDIEIAKIEDSDNKAFGTLSQWRRYRRELRSWPEQQGFPNIAYRPQSPDKVKE